MVPKEDLWEFQSAYWGMTHSFYLLIFIFVHVNVK